MRVDSRRCRAQDHREGVGAASGLPVEGHVPAGIEAGSTCVANWGDKLEILGPCM